MMLNICVRDLCPTTFPTLLVAPAHSSGHHVIETSCYTSPNHECLDL